MIAAEQLRPDVAEARATYFARELAGVPLSDVVVLDESYATTKFTRLRGRSLRGTRVSARVPHGHWKLLTVIAAISVEGVVAAVTVDAPTDRDVFATFLREALLPALSPGRVIVMDNLASHHVAEVRGLLEGAGCRLVYLPPYSPDLSPIEPAWSKAKQAVRSLDPRTVPELEAAIQSSLGTINSEDCAGFFRGCGYTATNGLKVL